MRISLVVAASSNNVIGRDGGLPWRLPEDLRRFKKLTTGKPIIMGRATWESLGRPLPQRQNIVLTRRPELAAPGCDIAATPQRALQLAGSAGEVMIIGGGDIYRLFLPQAQRIYLTRVHATVAGDTVFPELEDADWRLDTVEEFPADGTRQYGFTFQVLQRRVAGDPG
ncbi:MAG: dihydrofolate reductase [Gammaproteobacteria bacterium]|nr:MAG: dihydrofolate reductase [Gammaproteobacteria bacterium]